jgi:uncharacterized protein YpuA (DUF1002 family)
MADMKLKEQIDFANFLERNKIELEKIKVEVEKEYGVELTQQGLQELAFLLFLAEEDEKEILSKLRKLLNNMFKKGLLKNFGKFLSLDTLFRKRTR